MKIKRTRVYFSIFNVRFIFCRPRRPQIFRSLFIKLLYNNEHLFIMSLFSIFTAERLTTKGKRRTVKAYFKAVHVGGS